MVQLIAVCLATPHLDFGRQPNGVAFPFITAFFAVAFLYGVQIITAKSSFQLCGKRAASVSACPFQPCPHFGYRIAVCVCIGRIHAALAHDIPEHKRNVVFGILGIACAFIGIEPRYDDPVVIVSIIPRLRGGSSRRSSAAAQVKAVNVIADDKAGEVGYPGVINFVVIVTAAPEFGHCFRYCVYTENS